MSAAQATAGGGIIRVARNRDNPFKTINTGFAQDARLSWAARGLLVYLLSKPDDWSVKTYDLIRQSPAGRDAVLRILKELEIFGYLHRMQTNAGGGRFEWVSTVYEQPHAADTIEPPSRPEPQRPVPPYPAFPYMVEPEMVKPEMVKPDTVLPDTEKPVIDLLKSLPSVEPPTGDQPPDRPTQPSAGAGEGGEEPSVGDRAAPVDLETVRYLKQLGVRAWKPYQALPYAAVAQATGDVRDNPRLIVHRLKQLAAGEWDLPSLQPPGSAAPPDAEQAALADLWCETLGQLEAQLTPAQYAWFQDSQLLALDDPQHGTVVGVPNVMVRDFIRSDLLQPLVGVLGRDVHIELGDRS